MEEYDGEKRDATIVIKGFIHNYLKNDGIIKLPTPAPPGRGSNGIIFQLFLT
jgi:hypothetical protein